MLHCLAIEFMCHVSPSSHLASLVRLSVACRNFRSASLHFRRQSQALNEALAATPVCSLIADCLIPA